MTDRKKSPGWRILGKPTTGNGYDSGQKPKLSETNLGQGKGLGSLLRGWRGKHHKK